MGGLGPGRRAPPHLAPVLSQASGALGLLWAASQLTQGAEELSGGPRPALPGRGARAAIGQHSGPPGPQRPSDIREAIKGGGGARACTAAPPGCERLRASERTSEPERGRKSGGRSPGASPPSTLAPRLHTHLPRRGPAPARPQLLALGRRGLPRDSTARRRVPRQRLGRQPRPAAPSAPCLPGSPFGAPAPGQLQSFPGSGGGCAPRRRWQRS